ncbi:hypothetical protein HXX76_011097 [Chlamydomonas incerta]|uniref:SRCR domain-containing protein n=1 Tax=Chlamydomonas incerta TaxID=51695 RepID=A0A835SYX2_CHLIN|nr:hypothetical protein HXX76_011097 [Chlamydomonas incerta]|eukprot:KAG2429330.1 hypothetical protein HXX76_011097 [Chlamydomonas incerta]
MSRLSNCSFAWPNFDEYAEEAGGLNNLVGVECSNEPDGQLYQLRLWGGPTSNSGLVHIWFNGTWGTVDASSFDWRSARVACRELGYANGRPVYNSAFGQSPDGLWLMPGSCNGSEARLVDCENSYLIQQEYHSQEYRFQDVGVVCNNDQEPEEGAVRLVGGPSPNRGQVEVFWSGTWGGLWNWDLRRIDLSVICRQLNFSGGGVFDQAMRGKESPGLVNTRFAPMWKTTFTCMGNETRLTQCPNNNGYWTSQLQLETGCDNCWPLLVVCSNDTLPPDGSLRLVRPINGTTGSLAAVLGNSLPNSSYGTLQVLRNSCWGLVSQDGFGWRDARVACRQLGFKSGRAVGGVSYDPGLDLKYWMRDVQCLGNETRLVDCEYEADDNTQG